MANSYDYDAEQAEIKRLLALDDEELTKAKCPFCGNEFHFHINRTCRAHTRKEIAEIKATGHLGYCYDSDIVACDDCAVRIWDCQGKSVERFYIRFRKNGDFVCEAGLEVYEAKQALAEKESEDKELGVFEEDTYEIFDRFAGRVFETGC